MLALSMAMPISAQQPSESQPSPSQRAPGSFTLKVNSDLVLTNVVVRDKKTGELVRGLTAKDFTLQENGKTQQITSFDFESVDQAAPLDEATINGRSGNGIMGNMNRATTSEQLRNHRLIVMFFDITSMQPEDLERAQEAARNYIQKQMQPSDLASVVSLDNSLSLDQDFTANKQLLLHAVNAYSGTQGSGFEQGATSTTNQVGRYQLFYTRRVGVQRCQYRPRALRHRGYFPFAGLYQRKEVVALFLRRHSARWH